MKTIKVGETNYKVIQKQDVVNVHIAGEKMPIISTVFPKGTPQEEIENWALQNCQDHYDGTGIFNLELYF